MSSSTSAWSPSATGPDGEPRFHLLRTVASFARRWLDEAGELDAGPPAARRALRGARGGGRAPAARAATSPPGTASRPSWTTSAAPWRGRCPDGPGRGRRLDRADRRRPAAVPGAELVLVRLGLPLPGRGPAVAVPGGRGGRRPRGAGPDDDAARARRPAPPARRERAGAGRPAPVPGLLAAGGRPRPDRHGAEQPGRGAPRPRANRTSRAALLEESVGLARGIGDEGPARHRSQQPGPGRPRRAPAGRAMARLQRGARRWTRSSATPGAWRPTGSTSSGVLVHEAARRRPAGASETARDRRWTSATSELTVNVLELFATVFAGWTTPRGPRACSAPPRRCARRRSCRSPPRTPRCSSGTSAGSDRRTARRGTRDLAAGAGWTVDEALEEAERATGAAEPPSRR